MNTSSHYQTFQKYQSAVCGSGIKQPIWVGLDIKPQYYSYVRLYTPQTKIKSVPTSNLAAEYFRAQR
jgi:hypothetical protein